MVSILISRKTIMKPSKVFNEALELKEKFLKMKLIMKRILFGN